MSVIATFTVIQVTEIHTDSVRSPQRKILLVADRPDYQIELLHGSPVKVGTKLELREAQAIGEGR